MGADNRGDSTGEGMDIPTSVARSSKESGVAPSPATEGGNSKIGCPIPISSRCSEGESGGSADTIGGADGASPELGKHDISSE